MEVLALVPARGGSTRVPGKNLALVGGRSLVRRALDTAVAAGVFAEVALSSDSEAILAEGAQVQGVTIVRRPAELAAATSRALPAVVHALDERDSARSRPFDAVAIVQCTSPFTAPADLRQAFELLEATSAGSVVSVARVEAALHPLKLKRLEGDRLVPYLTEDDMTPSHELPPLWVRNGSVYLTRSDELRAGRLIAEDVRAFEMPPERSHDIDTPLDLAVAQLLAGRR